jgi:hypothetical protein
VSHPRELIQAIQAQVAVDYPLDRFVYQIEKAIPGTRMFPDLLVRDGISGAIQCVVEIGYTRPEKLTTYRDRLQIPDVRWYDKSGRLHPGWQTRGVRAVVEVVAPAPEQVFLYEIGTAFICAECLSEWFGDLPGDLPSDQRDALIEEADEECTSGVALLVTDYIKAFLPTVCDTCGALWMAEDDGALGWGVVRELEDAVMRRNGANLRDFGRRWGSRTATTWAESCRLTRELGWDRDLSYLTDGAFVQEDSPSLLDAVRSAVKVQTGFPMTIEEASPATIA